MFAEARKSFNYSKLNGFGFPQFRNWGLNRSPASQETLENLIFLTSFGLDEHICTIFHGLILYFHRNKKNCFNKYFSTRSTRKPLVKFIIYHYSTMPKNGLHISFLGSQGEGGSKISHFFLSIRGHSSWTQMAVFMFLMCFFLDS